jgi:SHS2 domain-containing protein
MGYRLLEHTADVLAECEGASLEALFESAAQALYAVALEEASQQTSIERQVSLRAPDRETLLVQWLQELIYLMDVERFIGSVFAFESLGSTELHARIKGYTCNPVKRAAEVKAATHHQAAVRRTQEGWTACILFDL